ncbi:hypothetical protein DFJ73DRAFT_854135 [Zopfochytrium polystomum]|nr:hypothetical protein DFJ73DRAFT_854135 [Zopfochytrium polystomum]
MRRTSPSSSSSPTSRDYFLPSSSSPSSASAGARLQQLLLFQRQLERDPQQRSQLLQPQHHNYSPLRHDSRNGNASEDDEDACNNAGATVQVEPALSSNLEFYAAKTPQASGTVKVDGHHQVKDNIIRLELLNSSKNALLDALPLELWLRVLLLLQPDFRAADHCWTYGRAGGPATAQSFVARPNDSPALDSIKLFRPTPESPDRTVHLEARSAKPGDTPLADTSGNAFAANFVELSIFHHPPPSSSTPDSSESRGASVANPSRPPYSRRSRPAVGTGFHPTIAVSRTSNYGSVPTLIALGAVSKSFRSIALIHPFWRTAAWHLLLPLFDSHSAALAASTREETVAAGWVPESYVKHMVLTRFHAAGLDNGQLPVAVDVLMDVASTGRRISPLAAQAWLMSLPLSTRSLILEANPEALSSRPVLSKIAELRNLSKLHVAAEGPVHTHLLSIINDSEIRMISGIIDLKEPQSIPPKKPKSSGRSALASFSRRRKLCPPMPLTHLHIDGGVSHAAFSWKSLRLLIQSCSTTLTDLVLSVNVERTGSTTIDLEELATMVPRLASLTLVCKTSDPRWMEVLEHEIPPFESGAYDWMARRVATPAGVTPPSRPEAESESSGEVEVEDDADLFIMRSMQARLRSRLIAREPSTLPTVSPPGRGLPGDAPNAEPSHPKQSLNGLRGTLSKFAALKAFTLSARFAPADGVDAWFVFYWISMHAAVLLNSLPEPSVLERLSLLYGIRNDEIRVRQFLHLLAKLEERVVRSVKRLELGGQYAASRFGAGAGNGGGRGQPGQGQRKGSRDEFMFGLFASRGWEQLKVLRVGDGTEILLS